MSEGWIKLHRKILDNDTFRDRKAFMVFTNLLLMATHKPYRLDRKGHEIFLNPGQVFVSVRAFAGDLKLGYQVVRRVFDLLENRRTIKTETNAVGTIVTICNWTKYQADDREDNAAPTQQPTQHQRSTNAPNNNVKNEKNDSQEDSVPSGLVDLAPPKPTARPHKKIAENMVRVFNHHLGDVLQRAEVTPRRVRTLSIALKDDFNDDGRLWSVFCQRVAASDFLTGRKADWRASLDWIIKPANRTKILEGNYDNRSGPPGPGHIDHDAIAKNLAEKFNGGFEQTDDSPRRLARLGQGNGLDADSEDQRTDGRANHGGSPFEIPDWFDDVSD